MHHLTYRASSAYKIAILVKPTSFKKAEVYAHYVEPLVNQGINLDEFIVVSLPQEGKKPSAAFMKEQLEEILPELDSYGVEYLYVTDPNYFKALTGSPKADPHFGYVLACKDSRFEDMHVVLGLNHAQLFYDPSLQQKLDLSLETLASHLSGNYQPIGQDIIHGAYYPNNLGEIGAIIADLHQFPELTADIEAFSLKFNEAGIGSIAFAWDQHHGVAFACDYEERLVRTDDGIFGDNLPNPQVRLLLKTFFENYQGRIHWHGSSYDLKVLIYTLWMKDGLDTKGLLKGLEVMTRCFGDTKIIAYLATNSCAGNTLGLKALAHEFAGNWAVEVKDIRTVPRAKLLRYNLVDALCTWFVRNKYEPIMVTDQQEDLYRTLMLPSLKLILQLELTGMALNPTKVKEAKAKLEGIRDTHLAAIHSSPLVAIYNNTLQVEAMTKANAKLKIKQHPLSKFADLKLNPNSGPQLQGLLYDQLGMPVIDLTDSKQPAVGAETLEKLIKRTQDPQIQELLRHLIEYSKATKILSTFIPAFEAAIDKGDGVVWLHGNFNLGGTVSGRLSSSDPNLQNLPANSVYGKLIKSCFMAPPGWLFCGADFNSLEDYISALTTRDPNKLKVYEQGFDGHCLRAAFYYSDQLTHIDVNDPVSVNSIQKTHKSLRQDSKTPTFALTYQGTYHTLMANEGWDEEKAKRIEAKYHELYAVSDKYIADKLKQASKDGFVTVAFGLRVRTPLIKQVVWGAPRMPFEAAAEGRTAGNALGQSYGLLNNRAAVEFFEKVWASKYRCDIKPVALIHDAIYILVRDSLEVMHWANRELINSMRWQNLPEIQHPTVKLGAALDIYWPSWAEATTLPNDADPSTIVEMCEATRAKYESTP